MEAKQMTKKTKKQDKPEPIERIKDDSSEIKKETPATFMGLERRYQLPKKDENAPKTTFEKKQEKVQKRLARWEKDGIIL
jgi:hypothetical protein